MLKKNLTKFQKTKQKQLFLEQTIFFRTMFFATIFFYTDPVCNQNKSDQLMFGSFLEEN